jgi:hypothetical protein
MADGYWILSESGSKAPSVVSRLTRASRQRRDALVSPARSWRNRRIQATRKLLSAVVERAIQTSVFQLLVLYGVAWATAPTSREAE